ncbi:MAG: DUF1552 domain-containing protein [Planctomycetia bacterium]|nr:DUF1552 domain-containing protein [Planctomycetia bacterium]
MMRLTQHVTTNAVSVMSRRAVLRGVGAAVALPWLESLGPHLGRGVASEPVATGDGAAAPPRRMVCAMVNTGLIPEHFFPKDPGRDYQPSPYLEPFGDLRKDLTVFSGVSHPDVSGGHCGEQVFLTGAREPRSVTFRNSISVDQVAAEQLGNTTRFQSLVLAVGERHDGLLSVTRDGVFIPTEQQPSEVYRKLFLPDTADQSTRRLAEIERGASILDFVLDKARPLAQSLPSTDRQRLDQYFTSVRELEQRFDHAKAWQARPKPVVGESLPKDIPDRAQMVERMELMYAMTRLALETDSTRFVSLYLNPLEITPKLPGVSNRTHALTHHGNEPEKLAELRRIDEAGLGAVAGFLRGLAGVNEGDVRLLDNTMVLFGSNMSNGNAHLNTNLPILLAGGGFRHGQHLAFDQKNNLPLANVFVSMLQRLGLETDAFSSSTGTVTGLEMV